MGCDIDLDACSAIFINSIYDPEKKPVCLRILARTHGPNATCSVFRTGALQASGTTSAALAHDLIRKVARRISQKLELKHGQKVKLRGYALKQCSMHGNLCIEEGWQLNLTHVQNALPEYFRCIYEPEMNPALKVEIHGILVDIFTSGKCIVRGKDDEEDAQNAYKTLVMEFAQIASNEKIYQQKQAKVTDAQLRKRNPRAKKLAGKKRKKNHFDDLDDFIVDHSEESEPASDSDDDF
jgi:TATA-box binding protein (TBP) (component of TFIID and TFIIIB)